MIKVVKYFTVRQESLMVFYESGEMTTNSGIRIRGKRCSRTYNITVDPRVLIFPVDSNNIIDLRTTCICVIA